MATPTANNDAGPVDPLDPPSATVPLSTMRRVIGARLLESKQNAPHFYLSVDIDIDPVLQLRERLKRENSIEVPSVNDCVVAATARALREVPSLNARIDGNRLRMFEYANIGVAVALPGGLVVPVLREADRKDLLTLGQEMRALAARARANKLIPDDYRGATFTVSNLGMFGVREFVAILNPPQAGILALGQAAPRPVVRSNELSIATVMTATLSADHRVVDGVNGAEFLQALMQQLANPESLLEPTPGSLDPAAVAGNP